MPCQILGIHAQLPRTKHNFRSCAFQGQLLSAREQVSTKNCVSVAEHMPQDCKSCNTGLCTAKLLGGDRGEFFCAAALVVPVLIHCPAGLSQPAALLSRFGRQVR